MTHTDTPEQIWVTSDGYYDHVTPEYDGYEPTEDETQYTRTDTIQATVDAAVAAERERCLDIARSMLPKDHGEIVDAGRDYCEGVRDVCAAMRKGGK